MVESPCINICKLDQATGLCIGCLRSVDEIRAWRDATSEQKLAIIEAARQRTLQPA